jgi:hypothetical protein
MVSTLLASNKAVLFLFLFLCYALFPTHNSSLDAFAYAGYVEYNSYLFKPHHLLSHAFVYLLTSPFEALGISVDTLWFGKFINALFQVINLWVFYNILKLLKVNQKQTVWIVFILAFSSNLWQYSTENEVYIIPILFSLLGSYYFLKNSLQSKVKYIVLSGFFAAVACLFHQLHFFWWLGLLIGFCFTQKNLKSFVFYATPALLVPITYALVLVFYEQQELSFTNLYQYMLYDFLQEGIVEASYSWKGWKSILFQLINTVRIFLQAHPNIYVLLKTHWIYFIPLIVSLVVGFRLLWQFFKQKNVFKKRQNDAKLFSNIHLFIAIALYLFAFYSYGNIEFLVSLPFALFLFLGIKFTLHPQFAKRFVLLLFIWNFSFAIFPDFYYSYYNDEKLVDYIVEHPDDTFLVKNSAIGNQYFYKTGINYPPNVLFYDKVNKDSLQIILKSKPIYTDVIDKPEVFNRQKIDGIGSEKINLNSYQKDSIFSFEGLYGISTVYKLSQK